jgi:hypothetical protein
MFSMALGVGPTTVQFISAANSGGTTGSGYIEVLVGGSTRYIRLNSTS